jgi:hypothetical protein
MVYAFEGNKAETKTMLPVIKLFMTAHQLKDVTVVADAGMLSNANKRAIEDAGLSFILGMRIPAVPYVIDQWRRDHPDKDCAGYEQSAVSLSSYLATGCSSVLMSVVMSAPALYEPLQSI